MTQEIVSIITDLGLPISISLGLAYALYRIITWLLNDVVASIKEKFGSEHQQNRDLFRQLINEVKDELDELKSDITEIRQALEQDRKELAELKSDVKVYVDLSMKGKQ